MFARTGKPKTSYRGSQTPVQGRKHTSAGENAHLRSAQRAPKREEVELAEFREAVHNSKSRVAQ